MNQYPMAGHAGAVVAIVGGFLLCFWGYRILKVSLGILGFAVGACAGWEGAASVAQARPEVALGCALLGGLIGMGLCLWLFYLGIFLAGAAAGTVVAAAMFNATGHQMQPLVYIGIPLLFGIIAVVAQRFMLTISTAFSGAYLIVAGAWPFVAPSHESAGLWLHPSNGSSAGMVGYGALAAWLVLGLVGATVQFRRGHKKVEVETKPK